MKNKTVGCISLVVLLSITSFFSINLYFQQRSAHDQVDIMTFPYNIGDWKGRDLEVEELAYDILETRNLILREYTNSSNEQIYLFIIYSETNRAVFHPPEVCLIGSGIKIIDKKTEEVDFGRKTFLTNKLYTKKDDYESLVLYSYKSGDFYTDNFYLQQGHFAFNQLFGKQVKGATIRVSMQIKEDEEFTLVTLKNFLRESAKIIDSL